MNRKSGVGARPPHMRTHASGKGANCTPTMAELGEADEAELQRLVAAEQQKAQFTAQVRGQRPGRRGRRVKYRSPALAEPYMLGRRRDEAARVPAPPSPLAKEPTDGCPAAGGRWCSQAR